MKRLFSVILTILIGGVAYALPVGNPSEASLFTTGVFLCGGESCCDPCDPCFSWCDAWSLRVGFYGDYVFDRHLHSDFKDLNNPGIVQSEFYTNAGYLALNFCNRVDVFANLGSTSITLTGEEEVFFGEQVFIPELPVSIVYKPTFSWGIGARATLWECNCFAVGLEGQYFRTNPRYDAIIFWPVEVDPQSNEAQKSHYHDWQVGLGASYRLALQCPSMAMVPYLAVKWGGAKMKNGDDDAGIPLAPHFESDNTWGYAVGTSLTFYDRIGFTVEGRFGDERAFYVNGQMRF